MAGERAPVTEETRLAKRTAMRRATLQLIIGVGILDTVAMGVFYMFFKDAPSDRRIVFTVVWTIITALVVMVLLRRVRKARFAKY
jgi:hypothetical protein